MSRILITDDSVAQRIILSGIVKKMGHDVETAINGRDALEKIHNNPPDCVLLDMLMPEVDGIQVLETLQGRGVTIPIIVLTADVQEWLKTKCLELGATTLINKPVKQIQLEKVFQETLSTLQPSEAPCT